METTASEYLCAAECRAALRQQIRRALEAGPLNEIEIARACCYDPVDGHGRVVLRRVLSRIGVVQQKLSTRVWVWRLPSCGTPSKAT